VKESKPCQAKQNTRNVKKKKLSCNEVTRRTFCIMGLRVDVWKRLKQVSVGEKETRDKVSNIRPETRRATPEQEELNRTIDGRPNPLLLQKLGMT